MQEKIALSSGLVAPTGPARFIQATLGLLATVAGLAACGPATEAQAQGGAPHAAPVSVAPAVQRAIADSEEFSGRLEATEFVELRPRVGGTIDKVHFTDGAMVKKGDLLFSIDPRPFEAQLASAQSQLTAAKARLELSRSELARAQKLLDQQAVSKQEFDQLSASSRTSLADQQTAEAAVRIAALNLDYTKVRSPISGRASRANITVGNLVSEQSVLTTIAGVARVYAYFEGSETTYLKLKSAAPGSKVPKVQMGLANEAGFPHAGQIDFVDNQLNPQTGAIRMRATFDNGKGQFTPGLAARLKMEDATPHDAVLVADRAIGTDQNKKYVYVVAADGKPQFREVKLGAVMGGMRVILGGAVKPGENVIVDGLQRVIPGMPVAPQVLKVDDKACPSCRRRRPPGAAPAKPEAKS